MKRLWLLVNATSLSSELAPVAPQRGGRNELPGLARPAPEVVRGARAQPFQFGKPIQAQVCHSIEEAEEVANEILRTNPNLKFIIFEGISFIEIVPSSPILKRWNPNGELELS